MKILFLFLDGVGLGEDNTQTNPFVLAKMPVLSHLLEGQAMIAPAAPFVGQQATLLALDACLGTPGVPQSATGQASLLTGRRIPAELGYHYGPKPNSEIAATLKNGNLFSRLNQAGKSCAFLNAYPPGYFQSIQSGRRIYAAIPMAATSAGVNLRNIHDLYQENALAADFTALGWREHLNLADAPLLSPAAAGRRLAYLAQGHDFSLFEYWLSDYAGHKQDMERACQLLEIFDQVLGGLVEAWDEASGLILLTSDHGNLEDLSTRRHTLNPVPALLVGSDNLRKQFSRNLEDIAGVTPAILRLLNH